VTTPRYGADDLFAAAYAYSPRATENACWAWNLASPSKQQSWLWDVSDSPDIQRAAVAFLDALVR
jgi:hypothetical protein